MLFNKQQADALSTNDRLMLFNKQQTATFPISIERVA